MDEYMIEVNDLKEGMYFMQVYTGEGFAISKVVKM